MVGMLAPFVCLWAGVAGEEAFSEAQAMRAAPCAVRLLTQEGAPLANADLSVQQIAQAFLVGWRAGSSSAPPALTADFQAWHAVISEWAPPINAIEIPPDSLRAQAQLPPPDAAIAAAEVRGATVMATLPRALDAGQLEALLTRYGGHIRLWKITVDLQGMEIAPPDLALLTKAARQLAPDARFLLQAHLREIQGDAERLASYVRACVAAGAELDGVAVAIEPSLAPQDDSPLQAALAMMGEAAGRVFAEGLPAAQATRWLPLMLQTPAVAGVVFDGAPGEIAAAARCLQSGIWHTQALLKSDPDGRASFTAYPGTYELACAGHVWKFRFDKGATAPIELRDPPTPEPPATFEAPFAATSAEEARAWQARVRRRLAEIVSAQNPRHDSPLDVQMGEAVDHGEYTARDLTFCSNEGQRIEATLTVPRGEGPFPAILCLHGHGGNRAMVYDGGTNYLAFAEEFAERGFVTLAPSLAHCSYAPNQLWNLMRLVDLLEAQKDVDPRRIGVAGLSMGGEWSMWLAIMDLRIRAAVVSGWMCTTQGVLSINNCPCWMPPGLVDLCDIAEAHILMAPRPMLFQSAEADECFPLPCTIEGYREILHGYASLEAPLAVRQHTFPGGHAWNGAVAYGFMQRALMQHE